MTGSRDLIESSNVPDLERLAIQEMLNAMTARGELSGPPLKEDGKDSEAYQQRLRERDARMTIMGSVIAPSRPTKPAEVEAARATDQETLAAAKAALTEIPDEVYNGTNPRHVCVAKLRALEEAFGRKWSAAAEAIEAINGHLANPPAPDALLLPNRRFDIAGLETHLVALRRAETALDGFPEDDREKPALAAKVMAYQQAIVVALGGGKADPVAQLQAKPQAPQPVAPKPTAPPAIPPAPRKPPPPPPTPLDPEQQAWQEWCATVTALGPAARAARLAELEAGGAGPEDAKVGFLASLILQADPAQLAPETAVKLDEGGLRALAARSGEAPIAGFAPGVRMAIARELTQHGGPRGDARGALAGALGAGLVRQFPKALPELLNAQGPNRGAMLVYTAKGLTDDEIVALGREAVHAIYKGIGAPGTDEARRQSARMGRLSQRK
jgi:hypothetical protein